MSEFARWPSFFIEVVGKRDGFPHRTELKGFIACDVTGRIHESTGTTRTMVTIVRLREIQPFGFGAATGPAAAWSGHCRRRRRPEPASFVIRLIAMRSKPHCGNPVACYRLENNGVEDNDARTAQTIGAGGPPRGVLAVVRLAADGAAALESEDSPKIFEEFALTSATTEAPAPMGYPPAPAASPAPCRPGPHGQLCRSRSGLLRSQSGLLRPRGGNCCAPACGNSCCNDCCSSCQHETGVFDCCTHSLSNFFSCGENCCPQFYAGVEATMFDAITHGMHTDAGIANTVIPNDVSLANGDGFDRFTFSPRITAGIQEGCWGILGRFWYLSDSSSGLNPAFPPAGAGTYYDDADQGLHGRFRGDSQLLPGHVEGNFRLRRPVRLF